MTEITDHNIPNGWTSCGSPDYNLAIVEKLFKIIETTGGITGIIESATKEDFNEKYILELEWVDEPHEKGKTSHLYFIHRHFDGAHVISRYTPGCGGMTDYIKVFDLTTAKQYL